jgi:hypothetical protein
MFHYEFDVFEFRYLSVGTACATSPPSPRLVASCVRARQIFSDLPFSSEKVASTSRLDAICRPECSWTRRGCGGKVDGSRLSRLRISAIHWSDGLCAQRP